MSLSDVAQVGTDDTFNLCLHAVVSDILRAIDCMPAEWGSMAEAVKRELRLTESDHTGQFPVDLISRVVRTEGVLISELVGVVVTFRALEHDGPVAVF